MKRCCTVVAGPARVLLGVFVLGQALFLLGSLVLNVEEAFRPWKDVSWLRAFHDNERNGFRQYGQLTAQRQEWALFAPDTWKEFAFLEVELRWDDKSKSVHLRAKDEPENLNAFVRLSGFRIRKYEASITPAPAALEVWFGDVDPEGEQPAAWEVYEEADRMLAYLRWRLVEYRRAHPERPLPSQVLLWRHGYRIPEPPGPRPWRYEDLGTDCIGRWLPPREGR